MSKIQRGVSQVHPAGSYQHPNAKMQSTYTALYFHSTMLTLEMIFLKSKRWNDLMWLFWCTLFLVLNFLLYYDCFSSSSDSEVWSFHVISTSIATYKYIVTHKYMVCLRSDYALCIVRVSLKITFSLWPHFNHRWALVDLAYKVSVGFPL